MKPIDILFFILPILTGYLIGSFLPGYFLPLWVKKLDIRKVGDGNPGIINVNRNAGFGLAFLTGLYDVPKGLLSVFLFLFVFKQPLSYAYLAGVSAVLGHKFPFYLGFKGGRGIAATVGLFLFVFIKILGRDFALSETLSLFVFTGIYALLVLLASHGKGDLFTVSIFPIIGIHLLLFQPVSADLILLLALVCIMTAEASRNLRRDKISLLGEKAFSWRTVARALALLFIPLGMVLQKVSLLIIIGILLSIFFLFDLFRMLIPKVEDFSQRETVGGLRLCKKEEAGKLASPTTFLTGLFLCFLLLERNIAFASVGFVSLGGMFAELAEANFGERRIFVKGGKTLEGSLAFLSGAVIIAFFLWSGKLLSLPVMVLGALTAALTTTISGRGEDSFSIALVSGAVMSLL